ncbi:CvpA family protein [candidate division WOR-3 bacterium]|nr:CvpA family protein [candidate division WOR-3 bacterium]
MMWYDWMCLGIVLAAAITQSIRGTKAGGMGLPLFEALGIIVAGFAATKLYAPLGRALGLGDNKWIALIAIFVVLCVVAFLVARWLFTILSWSFESMNAMFSFLWGVAAGWVIANVALRVVIEIQGGATGAVGAIVLGSEEVRRQAPIANEIMNFRTWHAIMRLLFKAKLGPDFNPDVG